MSVSDESTTSQLVPPSFLLSSFFLTYLSHQCCPAYLYCQLHASTATMSTRQSKTSPETEVRTSGSVFDIEPEGGETIIRRLVNVFQRYIQPCMAELVGSALFIFTGCMSVIENPQDTGSLQPALAHGLALSIVIALFGEIRYSHACRFMHSDLFIPCLVLCLHNSCCTLFF